MKKTLCAVLASVLLFAVMCIGVAADFDYATPWTEYTVLTASEISFDYRGDTTATAKPQGGGTLEHLIDGEIVAEPTHFDNQGIVLVCNDFIKPDYEVDMATAEQPLDAIPEFYFTLKYDEEVTFDTVYLSLFYQMKDCVAAPGENRVIVETSEDGDVWLPVGDDGMFYYRNNQPEYTGAADPYQEEIVVPLGEEITSQYVRLTFTFKIRPESDTYWAYYTNVYEWAGFTELAVAQYTGGDEQEVMDQEYASAPALDLVDTVWIAEGEEGMIDILSFYQLEGQNTMCMSTYDAAAFEESGLEAEALLALEMPYTPSVDHIVAELMEEYVVFYLSVEDDGTLYYSDDEGTEMYLDPYTPEEPEVSSEPEESSEAESSEEEEESEEASETESKPSASAPSTATSSDAPADDEGGFPIWAIVLIVVAVVAIVVVVVVIAKKKK